jgi:hypothetical protein
VKELDILAILFIEGLVDTMCVTKFRIKKLNVLLTEYIYVFMWFAGGKKRSLPYLRVAFNEAFITLREGVYFAR